MRLLFISNLFPDTREPHRGLDNATLLHALSPHWEIRAVALRPSLPWARPRWQPRAVDVPLRPEYVPVPYLPKFGTRWNHRLSARALRRRLGTLRREWAWDAVLAAWLFPDACAVARLREEFGFRFTAIAQGSDVHQYLAMPGRRAVMLEHLRAASAIITRSAELARLLAEAGLRKDRLHPVYNGVDPALFAPDPMAKATDGKFILYVGNFLPIKNPHLLFDAFEQVRKLPGMADVRLVMVGGGPMEDELRRRAAPLGDAVQFAGRQDAAGVARFLRAVDVLALSSHNEGVPNVVLEAFACGVPVVSTRVGGIAEIHPGAGFGALTPPGDAAALALALHQVLTAPPDRAAIAARGRSYTWQNTAAAYDRVLKASLR